MPLVRFSQEDGRIRPGYLAEGTVFDLSANFDASTAVLSELEDISASLSDLMTFNRADVRLHTPTSPSKIIRLVGCYSREHGEQAVDPHAESAGFNDMDTPSLRVAPISTLTDPGSDITLPQQAETVTPGVELVAVIGQEAHELSVENALDAVAGFTVSIDAAVQDEMPGLEGYRMFDTFLPVGPGIVPATEVNPETLAIGLRKNAKPIGIRSTTDLRFSLAEIVSYASKVMTLYPGDLLTTGSPIRGSEPMEDGDELDAWIETIGTLRATVRSEVDS